MKKQDVTTKLAATEASLKRWQTRLKRAITKVNDLDRQRLRLQARMGPVNLTNLIGPPLSDQEVGANQETVNNPLPDLVQAVDDRLTEIIEAKPKKERDIPSFLDRSDPLIAERMTAARKKAEEEARHKMPLSGKAAMAAIMAVPVTPKKPRKRKA